MAERCENIWFYYSVAWLRLNNVGGFSNAGQFEVGLQMCGL